MQTELLSNRDPDAVKQKPGLSTRSLALRERSSSPGERVLAVIWISEPAVEVTPREERGAQLPAESGSAGIKTGRNERMKEPDIEGVATHDDPEASRTRRGLSLPRQLALVREENRILRARLDAIPPRDRPHYPPVERVAILTLRAARGWTVAETARRFLVTPHTIAD